MKLFGGKKNKHQFLRHTVRLCLCVMTIFTLGLLALAWHSGEQLNPAAVTAVFAAWCGELLMSLIKRRGDEKTETKQNNDIDF